MRMNFILSFSYDIVISNNRILSENEYQCIQLLNVLMSYVIKCCPVVSVDANTFKVF